MGNRGELVLLEVQERELMREMITLEPEVLLLLKTAAAQDDTIGNRWELYTNLKQQSALYVGTDAKHAELSMKRYFQAFAKALDELLPPPQEDDLTMFPELLDELEEFSDEE